MNNSKTAMETLFPEGKPAQIECITAAAVLFSDYESAKYKFGALLGEPIGDENGQQMVVYLCGMGDSLLIARIIRAAFLSAPCSIAIFLSMLEELRKKKGVHLTGAFRRGCILGLLSALASHLTHVDRLEPELREILATHFFNVFFALMWQEDEDDGFIKGEKAQLSKQVAEFITKATFARSAAFRGFMKKISTSSISRGGFPSPCARQVVTEFMHKCVTRLNGE